MDLNYSVSVTTLVNQLCHKYEDGSLFSQSKLFVPLIAAFLSSQKGFEPRGTAIGQRLVTWNNMVKNTGYKATLANYPFKYADEQAKTYIIPVFIRHHALFSTSSDKEITFGLAS